MTERKRHKKRVRARAAKMGVKYTEALKAPARSGLGHVETSDIPDPVPESRHELDQGDEAEREHTPELAADDGGLAEALDRAINLAGSERGAGASDTDADLEREDVVLFDLDTEECETKAEARAAATRFASAHHRQGYEVYRHEEAGLIVVTVRRAVPAPDVDFDDDEKRFTFPINPEGPDDGRPEGDHGGEAAVVDLAGPLGRAVGGGGPHPLSSVRDLLDLLALSQPTLSAFTSANANLYQHFTIPKRGHSRREIAKPVPPLMAVQRRILKLIVERLPAHDASHGYRVGRSTQTNAAVHVDSQMLVKIDFQDFSSAITLPRVRGVFTRAGYPEDVALALALLCTAPDPAGVRRLPQGAPTTPGLSNAVCFKLDRRLAGLASRLGWRFTRYGDDLTFSLPAGEGERDAGKLLGAIGRIVADEGFKTQPKKTRVVRSGSSQRVTGLVVNGPGTPRVPREVRRQQRAAAHHLGRSGDPAA
jgi:hypothetical protein